MEVPVLLVEFEGVIADTAGLRRDALREALAADGITPSDDAHSAAAGHPLEESVRRARAAMGLLDDPVAVELGRVRAERAFAERSGKGLMLQAGLRPALEHLAATCRLAIVTRAGRREVDFVLGLAGIEGIFRPVICAEDVSPPKPARAPYLAALARIGQLFPGQQLRPLAVEDHLVGVRAAREAGIPSVAVGSIPPHEALEADGWVETLGDLDVERVRSLLAASTGGER
jgi:beta-phosphoglucomutase-like phosphatase (HAD superfamily)